MKKLLLGISFFLLGINLFAQGIFPILLTGGQTKNVLSASANGLNNSSVVTIMNTGAVSLRFFMATSPTSTNSSVGFTVPAGSISSVTINQLGGLINGDNLNVKNLNSLLPGSGNLLTPLSVKNIVGIAALPTPSICALSTINAWVNPDLSGGGDLALCSSFHHVGIGTASPTSVLDINASENGNYAVKIYNSGGSGNGLLVKSSAGVINGAAAGSTILNVIDNLDNSYLKVDGSTGITTISNYVPDFAAIISNPSGDGKGLLIRAGSGQNNANAGNTLFDVRDNYDHSYFRINASDGTTYARAINVTLNNFPDYVFNKEYKLMPISVLEKFINKNKHLPEIPSESEVLNNGANIGDMVKLQMKKIEELTLYIIQQQKEIEELKKKVN